MEGLIPILINLASGAVGGNLAGALMKNLSMGTLWNSILGILGGGAADKYWACSVYCQELTEVWVNC